MSFPTITRDDQVAHFHKAAENITFNEGGDVLNHVLNFSEELTEFNEALSDYLSDQSEENRKQLIKEWCDVEYTLNAFPWFFDFDGQVAFNRVVQNNNTKIVDGKIIRNEYGKIMKPEGYVKADMGGL